jgi:CTP:molybdopterin cytidylyltransferase MocA
MKVPKKVRRKAKKAIRAAESPVVREFAAAAIGAVADARTSRAARAFGNGRELGRPLRVDANQLADTIRSAALDGIRRFLEGFDEGMREFARRSGAKEDPDVEVDLDLGADESPVEPHPAGSGPSGRDRNRARPKPL